MLHVGPSFRRGEVILGSFTDVNDIPVCRLRSTTSFLPPDLRKKVFRDKNIIVFDIFTRLFGVCNDSKAI